MCRIIASKKLLLGLEVDVDGSLRNSNPGGYIFDARRDVTTFDEFLKRSIQDLNGAAGFLLRARQLFRIGHIPP